MWAASWELQALRSPWSFLTKAQKALPTSQRPPDSIPSQTAGRREVRLPRHWPKLASFTWANAIKSYASTVTAVCTTGSPTTIPGRSTPSGSRSVASWKFKRAQSSSRTFSVRLSIWVTKRAIRSHNLKVPNYQTLKPQGPNLSWSPNWLRKSCLKKTTDFEKSGCVKFAGTKTETWYSFRAVISSPVQIVAWPSRPALFAGRTLTVLSKAIHHSSICVLHVWSPIRYQDFPSVAFPWLIALWVFINI